MKSFVAVFDIDTDISVDDFQDLLSLATAGDLASIEFFKAHSKVLQCEVSEKSAADLRLVSPYLKLTGATAAIRARQKIEQTIAIKVVDCALAAGYPIGVANGGDEEEVRSADRAKILATMFETDSETLYFYHLNYKQGSRPVGFVHLVYGNDGWDVISDYSCKLEELLKPAIELSISLDNS